MLNGAVLPPGQAQAASAELRVQSINMGLGARALLFTPKGPVWMKGGGLCGFAGSRHHGTELRGVASPPCLRGGGGAIREATPVEQVLSPRRAGEPREAWQQDCVCRGQGSQKTSSGLSSSLVLLFCSGMHPTDHLLRSGLGGSAGSSLPTHLALPRWICRACLCLLTWHLTQTGLLSGQPTAGRHTDLNSVTHFRMLWLQSHTVPRCSACGFKTFPGLSTSQLPHYKTSKQKRPASGLTATLCGPPLAGATLSAAQTRPCLGSSLKSVSYSMGSGQV